MYQSKARCALNGFQSISRFSLEGAVLRVLNQLYKDTPPRIYRTKVQRNKEIRERYAKGERAPDLALEYEVTEQRVYQILNLKNL
jgi:Mor family transcriptional regulator